MLACILFCMPANSHIYTIYERLQVLVRYSIISQKSQTGIVFLYFFLQRGHSRSLPFSADLTFMSISHFLQNGMCLHVCIIMHLISFMQMQHDSLSRSYSADSFSRWLKLVNDDFIFEGLPDMSESLAPQQVTGSFKSSVKSGPISQSF